MRLNNYDVRQHFHVLGRAGAGKALPDDPPINTVGCWRTMADIRVGDRISMPDGTSAWVDGVFPQGELDIYRVTFEDGRTSEACPEHLWEVFGARSVGMSGASPGLMRTREIGERSEEHTSELQLLMRISYAVLCLK